MKKIYYVDADVICKTDKGVLIRFPQKSKYEGWCFWHPIKFTHPMKRCHTKYINLALFRNDFVIRIRKYDSEEEDANLMEERIIEHEELVEAFHLRRAKRRKLRYKKRLKHIEEKLHGHDVHVNKEEE